MNDGAIVNMLRGWMKAADGPRDQRWQTRFDDIPRAVSTAREKFDRSAEVEQEGNPKEPILDRRNPMASARELMSKRFTTDNGLRTLWRHRGCFWLWNGSCYREANEETVRSYVWDFLDGAKRTLRYNRCHCSGRNACCPDRSILERCP
jgi:hypothetical protein